MRRCLERTSPRASASLITLLLLATQASADTISDINVEVSGDGYSTVVERVIVEGEVDYSIVKIPDHAADLNVADDTGNLTYEAAEIDGFKAVKISLRERLQPKTTKAVTLTYGTHYYTAKNAELWSFQMATAATPRKTVIRVKLPEGSKLESLKPESVLRTYVEDGFWVYPQESNYNFTASYQYNGVKSPLATTTLPAHWPGNISSRTLYGLILALTALVALSATFLYVRGRVKAKRVDGERMTVNVVSDIVAESKTDGASVSYELDSASNAPRGAKRVKESILNMLDENEASIIRLLEESTDDEVTQAYIYKTTGIPKSSLSDILKHLEKRNMIERREEGRLKWIKFKTWVLE